ncbi:hypothetical protein CHUAL_009634 [Chamberlinius hualienensis]
MELIGAVKNKVWEKRVIFIENKTAISPDLGPVTRYAHTILASYARDNNLMEYMWSGGKMICGNRFYCFGWQVNSKRVQYAFLTSSRQSEPSALPQLLSSGNDVEPSFS